MLNCEGSDICTNTLDVIELTVKLSWSIEGEVCMSAERRISRADVVILCAVSQTPNRRIMSSELDWR